MSGAPAEDRARTQELRWRFRRDGDPQAFSELATPHLDTIYTVCLRLLGDPVAAEDEAQETLIQALRKHDRYDPSRALRPWLLTIATNRCRDRRRSLWWNRVIGFQQERVAPAPSPEQDVSALERDRKVREALSRLPWNAREAVTLFHLEGMTYAEMSAATGVSQAALKQRVRRGLQKLQEILTEAYPELDLDRM